MIFLKLALAFYISVLAFGGLCAVFRFLFDIKRFKDKEERFNLFDDISKEVKKIEENKDNDNNSEGVVENGS